jgi:hypothetical protein
MKKLKLLPLLFLILLSGQVQAKTWEESMTTWSGIWAKVYSSDKAVSAQGRKEKWAQYTDRARPDPNYNYGQRKARVIAYAKVHISTNHPNMSAATTKGVIDWIARWHEATVEYPMNNEGASEQMLVDDESWLIYKYPSKLGDINAKLARQAAAEKARQAAAAEKARQAAVAEAQRRAEIMIPVLEVKAPIADVEWTTDQSTFDYIKTCTTMPFVAVITHGANHMDLLVEDDEGELVHERDMNIGYSRLADFCAVIAAPKSGLSTTYNEHDEAQDWRTWWMTEGVEDEDGIPVRDENAEVAATIALINLAKTAVGKPIYLVIGNDLGASAAMVLDKMTNDGEANLVDGFIRVHRDTGEFTTYHRDGTIWESKDNPVSE